MNPEYQWNEDDVQDDDVSADDDIADAPALFNLLTELAGDCSHDHLYIYGFILLEKKKNSNAVVYLLSVMCCISDDFIL